VYDVHSLFSDAGVHYGVVGATRRQFTCAVDESRCRPSA
jgi:hypothetical protein